MKTCALSIFLVFVVCTPSLDIAADDTLAVGVKVYACKPSDGDCYRLISKNRLTGISCDTVKAKYPAHIVVLENVQSPTDMDSAATDSLKSSTRNGFINAAFQRFEVKGHVQ